MLLVIRENMLERGVYIDFCMNDAAPPHSSADYPALEAAKAAYPGVEWNEPDEDCDGTVLAWGWE